MTEKIIEILIMNHYTVAPEETAIQIDTLYKGEIDKLKEIIQVQDGYIDMNNMNICHCGACRKIRDKIAELKKEAGI